MKSNVTDIKSDISHQTVLPALWELYTEKRGDDFLILNPRGPWWFIGCRIHADFLRLCDGKRSISDIHGILLQDNEGLLCDDLVRLAEALVGINFFASGKNSPVNRCSSIHFYVTRRCNLTCPFCFNDSTPARHDERCRELTAKEWIDLASEAAEINPNATVSVSGGEPLLRDDIMEIIDGISRNNLKIRLITNGTLVDKCITEYLSKVPGLKVQVSIDSLIPEENRRTRGHGSLEKALPAVLSMLEAGIDVGITSTITSINMKSTWRMKEFCRQHGIVYGTSFFFEAGKRARSNSGWLEVKPEEIMEAIDCVAGHSPDSDEGGITPKPGIRRVHCGMGCGQLSIHPDGSVSPCRLLLDPAFYLGNIQQDPLEQLLRLGCQRFDFIGVDTMTCGCNTCPVRYMCVGGCKAISFYHDGKLDSLPPNCALLKKIYIESLWASV
ncbi:radical SAM protein with 4Fe4S-binding SPASM domain [Anaerobacterium chartisolvens]|uniref:Radical SAM protein with 4Fe4S-binding SPASM domain n=1 Tax=Anaerobacterium chartisolvens TaxID=1297424 RepID=A0A369AS70_9FIRM|nr:radical SAM protein [Anaerobacterium chartisolvens]RCX12210.1 radical SAM protein with 4Fe4S-binding SPASM domain [Anaerobacterium chartisolvens]